MKSVENIVVGSGVAAFAAAFALRRAGQPFLILDAGYDLETAREHATSALAQMDPTQWQAEHAEHLFPPPISSSKGVEKRLAFGSNFPYAQPPGHEITCHDCAVEMSFARGGFGNVWGAAILPFADADLGAWPTSVGAMREAYARVLEYMPARGAADGLQARFPMNVKNWEPIPNTPMGARLGEALTEASARGKIENFAWGRARLAVEGSGSPFACRRSGYCLDGCAYGSIFNPRIRWRQLNITDVDYRGGTLVESFARAGDEWIVRARDLATDAPLEFKTKRVFLGAGAVSSTLIAARSLGRLDQDIPVADAQYFFFPAFLRRPPPTAPARDEFTLAEHFLELAGAGAAAPWTHLQIYTYNRIFQSAFESTLGPLARWKPIKNQLARRFLLMQGFLHSDLSERMLMRVGTGGVDVRKVANPETKRAMAATVRSVRKIMGRNAVVPPFLAKAVPPGRSFHVGASYPMARSPRDGESDLLAQPSGAPGIHLVDAAAFPTIPASTYAYSVMAHADRIVHEIYEKH